MPDAEVLKAIKSIAPFVARIGPSVEALLLQKNAGSHIYGFLTGGIGSDYYRWQVRALKAAKTHGSGLAIGQRSRPLTVGERGLLLGEGYTAAASSSRPQSKAEGISEIAGKLWACIKHLYVCNQLFLPVFHWRCSLEVRHLCSTDILY